MKRTTTKFFAASIVAQGMLVTSVALADNSPEFVPGEYVVKMKSHTTSLHIENLKQEIGTFVKNTIPSAHVVVVKEPVFETQEAVVQKFSQNPDVEYVEPNYIYRINKTPNDPLLGQLWGLKNEGQKDSAGAQGLSGVDISAEKAWDIETGSDQVVVAVIDTGVLYGSDDLKENIAVNDAELNGQAGIDDDKNGFIDDVYGWDFANNKANGLDDHGHGSHCSGTIGARGDDGVGLVGINWKVKILPVKFLSADGGGTLEGAIQAIDYARSRGVHIMSNSWGGGGFSKTLQDAIKRAADANILFVAAAGNESNNNDKSPSYPASYNLPNVLSVAAVDNKGAMADFSNFGAKSVHVGAPGVNIMSVTTQGYESWSGTSMATPHVSGIAALVKAHFPEMTAVQIKKRIVSSAVPLASLKGKTVSGGMANAYTALTSKK